MSGTEFTLELLGPIILEMRDELRDLKRDTDRRLSAIEEERLPAIERRLTSQSEDMTVMSAMFMRHAAEPIAWGVMQQEIRMLRERVETLERER